MAGTLQTASDRRSGSLAALALVLLLVVVGLRLVDVLRQTAALQDCALEGRSVCEAPP